MKLNLDLKTFSDVVLELRRWPGVSYRNLYRLALSFVRRSEEDVLRLCSLIKALKQQTRFCKTCFGLTELEECLTCSDPGRDKSKICVVASWVELFAIQSASAEFNGVFHVLGGLLSPLDGITPADLSIDLLLSRLQSSVIKELTFALSPTPEGEVTISFILSKIEDRSGFKVFKIARGVPVGAVLEYTDRTTLSQAFMEKQLVE